VLLHDAGSVLRTNSRRHSQAHLHACCSGVFHSQYVT
jgi:hypothetical protein